MKTLDQIERRRWCEDRGMRLDNSGLIGSTRSVASKVPEETHRLLDLVCELFSGEPQFPGGLFWIVDLGSRSDQVCEIALSIHSLMVETSGGTSTLQSDRGNFHFSSTKASDQVLRHF